MKFLFASVVVSSLLSIVACKKANLNDSMNVVAVETYLQYLQQLVYHQVNDKKVRGSDNNDADALAGSSTHQKQQGSDSQVQIVKVRSVQEAYSKIDEMYQAMSGLAQYLIKYDLAQHFVSHCKSIQQGALKLDVDKCALNTWLYQIFVSEFQKIDVSNLSGREQLAVRAKIQRVMVDLKTRFLYPLVVSAFNVK